MADSLSGASAPVLVSGESQAATVSPAAQGIYAEANSALTGATWADYETAATAAPVVEAEQPLEGDEPSTEGERPRNPDGTFKAKETDEVAPVGDEVVEGAEPEPVVEAEPEPFLLTIPSHRAGEPDIEIPFAGLSEAQQQDLNRLKNGYMRGEDARAKTAVLDGKLAELNEFEEMLRSNPEHVILKALSPEKRISIAVKLIAQDWEGIVPMIQQMDQDPVERIKTASKAEIELRDNQKLFEQRVAATKAAQTVRAALLATIPEGTPDTIADAFYDDAVRDIQRAEERGATITTQNLPALLEQRVKLYGFTKPSTTPVPAASIARAIARPAASPAPVAASAPSPEQDALQQARTGQARLSSTITAQRRAAGSAPPGAGAAPVKLPPLPKDADIATASAALKKAGRSWASM